MYCAGACGGVVACSTCHVVVHPEFFKKLPKAEEEELDMLDLAFGLTEWYGISHIVDFSSGFITITALQVPSWLPDQNDPRAQQHRRRSPRGNERRARMNELKRSLTLFVLFFSSIVTFT